MADAAKETHTGTPQQVSTAQKEPAGHVKVGDGPQLPIPAHEVLPSTQNPPPWALRTQTQRALAAHATNVAHVAPMHSGFGFEDCAETFATDAITIGATYAAPPICRRSPTPPDHRATLA